MRARGGQARGVTNLHAPPLSIHGHGRPMSHGQGGRAAAGGAALGRGPGAHAEPPAALQQRPGRPGLGRPGRDRGAHPVGPGAECQGGPAGYSGPNRRGCRCHRAGRRAMTAVPPRPTVTPEPGAPGAGPGFHGLRVDEWNEFAVLSLQVEFRDSRTIEAGHGPGHVFTLSRHSRLTSAAGIIRVCFLVHGRNGPGPGTRTWHH